MAALEPGTSQIAAAIADGGHSFYAFEGIRPGRPHGDLHITSSKFDEPQALALLGTTQTAIAIHGRADQGDVSTILVGGLNTALRDQIILALQLATFDATIAHGGLTGRDPGNKCNRCASDAGVQLEFPRALRNQLLADPAPLRALRNTVISVIPGRANGDSGK